MNVTLIVEITIGVFAARVLGDALAAVLMIQRSKKRRKAAAAQLEYFENLLAQQEARALIPPDSDAKVASRGPAEITE